MSRISCFLQSFRAAAKGFACTVREERNFRFHLVTACFVFWLRGRMGAYLSFSKAEDSVLFLTIGAVFAAELLNTAVENAVDLCSPQIHPLARKAKDAAAAGVLVTALAALAVGVRLFWHPDVLMQMAEEVYAQPIRLIALILAGIVGVCFIFIERKP